MEVPIRILVVDDEPDIRNVLRLLLTSRGYSVEEAANGREALEQVQKNAYDLIILDIMMPEMNGVDACAALREISSAPVLFLTAKDQDADKQEAFHSGGDDYLVKPFSNQELFLRVEALVRRYRIYKGKGEAPCHVRLIEPEPHLALGDEGFNLRTEKSDVVVRGGRRGMLYGVNELLETYGGIGWFSPWRTVVPKTGVLKVPDSLYDTQRPAFEMRYTDFYWCGDNDWSGQNVEPKREFFVHCRQNGAFKIRLQEKYGGFADAGLFVGGAGLCHTFLRLVPPEKYFKDHPEYYSEIGGVRRNGETQLCLTNPDVLEIMVSNLVVKIDADPQAKFYGVSQADWENYCTCAKCRAVDEEEGSHAGTLIRFVNAVAARIEKIRPGLTCETLAYQYTRKPPKKTRPAKNVAICLCNIECDHSLPLSAAGTAANEAFIGDFVAWSAITDNLYFWDYRWSFHAFPNLNSMQQNVKFFRDHGVRWLFEEGTCMHADFFALKCWLISKWM